MLFFNLNYNMHTTLAGSSSSFFYCRYPQPPHLAHLQLFVCCTNTHKPRWRPSCHRPNTLLIHTFFPLAMHLHSSLLSIFVPPHTFTLNPLPLFISFPFSGSILHRTPWDISSPSPAPNASIANGILYYYSYLYFSCASTF